MNDENQQNGAPRGPQIFTIPACGFIVALNLDWCDEADAITVSVETSPQEVGLD